MVLAVHTIVGAAIVNQIQIKWLGYLLAFLSHFLLDTIPHREYDIEGLAFGWKKKKFWNTAFKILLDSTIGFVFIIIFAKNRSNLPQMFIGGFCALLPDCLTLFFWLLKNQNFSKFLTGKIVSAVEELKDMNKTNWYRRFHQAFHLNNLNKRPPLIWGLMNQLIIFLTALFFL